MPAWMQSIATYNPVEWAVNAGREALVASPDWGVVLSRLGWLALFTFVCGWLATRVPHVSEVDLTQGGRAGGADLMARPARRALEVPSRL
jgi:hypothetical protein